jgi:hypothetical protein
MKTASSSKKHRYKNLQLKAVATDYLTNISLDGNSDNDLKKSYFESIISNEFNCFLNFNKISHERTKQTEYFKYYKNKLSTENSKLKSARLESFLKDEFSQPDIKLYIDEILSRKKKLDILTKKTTLNSRNPVAIKQLPPATTIIPSITLENEYNKSNILKSSISDVEADYIQNCLESDVTQFIIFL